MVGLPPSGNGNELIAVAIATAELEPLTIDALSPEDATGVGEWCDRLAAVLEREGEAIGDRADLDASLDNLANVPETLSQFYAQFWQAFDRWQTRKTAAERQQFQNRQRQDRDLTANALGRLAGVLNPQSQERFQEGEALLVAAGAVGRAAGIEIRPPASSEDPRRSKKPLDAIARASRMRTRRVLLDSNWWRRYCGPLLGYLEESGSPVALLPTPGDRYELYSPADQRRTPVTADIASQLSPEAFSFYRPLPDRAIDALGILRFALRDQQRNIALLVCTTILATLVGMLTAPATQILMDQSIPSANREMVLQVGAGLLVATLAGAVFQLVQALVTLRLQTIFDSTSQAGLWDRLMKLPLRFFRRYSSGDMLTRISAIDRIRQRLGGSVVRTLFSGMFAIANLGVMAFYSLKLAGIALGIGLLTLLVTALSGSLTRKKLRPIQEIEGRLSGLMVQLISGVSKLRVSGAEERAFAHWSKSYTEKLRLLISTQQLEDAVNTFNEALPLASSIAIFLMTSLIVRDAIAEGELPLTAGKFLGFNAAFGIFITGISDLSVTIIDVLDIAILWERAQPILAAMPEVSLDRTDPGRLYGEVKLDRVNFRYRDDGPLTLHEVTIAAKPGKFIGLVGPSGSGKSTIVRLLLGFETPEEGAIYLDGQDLSRLDIAAVRRQLGVVLQNGRIQSASVFDNIIGGQLATIDEAWDATRMAGFDADIQAMPMGMHTVISEGGSNLSGGQRQRLLISRALVSKPNLLIFDEATSALDNQTQAMVMQSLEQLRATRIVIAHRLSTIRHADRIYVLEAGQVVQAGSFDELAHQPGLFADLMRRQMTADDVPADA